MFFFNWQTKYPDKNLTNERSVFLEPRFTILSDRLLFLFVEILKVFSVIFYTEVSVFLVNCL